MIDDINGNVLIIGDSVYFTNYNSHRIYQGIIIKSDQKDIYIKANRFQTKMQLRFASSRIVKI